MGRKGHVRTRATVVRAGENTTLVSLADWYGGQILAPVETRIIEAAVGLGSAISLAMKAVR